MISLLIIEIVKVQIGVDMASVTIFGKQVWDLSVLAARNYLRADQRCTELRIDLSKRQRSACLLIMFRGIESVTGCAKTELCTEKSAKRTPSQSGRGHAEGWVVKGELNEYLAHLQFRLRLLAGLVRVVFCPH